MDDRLFLLKITLLESQPLIWRQFVVPATISLDRLHDVIQIAMGWHDCHLHSFTIGKKRFTCEPETRQEGEEEGLHRLSELLGKKGSSLIYHYDFDNDWIHEVVLEDNDYPVETVDFPIICLDGERACPPEDIGGLSGYQQFLERLQNPASLEESNEFDWMEEIMDIEDFDSEYFDIMLVNLLLVKYVNWSRNRHLPLFTA